MWISTLAALALTAQAAAPAQGFRPKPRPYDATHYKLELRLENDGSFQGTTTVSLLPKSALKQVELDAYGLTFTGVTLEDGTPATHALTARPERGTGVVTVTLPRPLAPGKEARLVLRYTGKAGTAHQGLFTVASPQKDGLPLFFTHLQTHWAQRVFPCNDQPDDKATTEVVAVVDGRYQVLSNGKKVKDEAFAEGGKNLRRVHWQQEQPHSTYLVALAVGEFETIPVDEDTPASLHVLKGSKPRSFIAADITKEALRFQAKLLGVKYPWAKYDQVVVPGFTWGGMENTSLSFMRENGLVLEHPNHLYGRLRIVGLVGHELAHQWFGDLVTAKWWDDTWLNEGFASYVESLTSDAYYDNDYVEVDRAYDTFVHYFREEDGPHARPLVSREDVSPEDLFDSTAYTKGAHVLRMAEHWVGTENFRKGLKAYLEKFGGKNATSKDFFDTVAQAAGAQKDKGFAALRDSWLTKKGYPVLTPETHWSGSKLTVTLRQKPNHAGEKGHFTFKLPVVFHRQTEPSFHEERVLVVDKPVVTATFELPAQPQWVNWNKDGVALARIEPSAVNEDAWTQAARSDPDPVWRLLASFVLLGELVNPDAGEPTAPTDAAMLAVQDVLRSDKSPYVRWGVLHRLSSSKWRRLPAELGPTLLELAKLPKGLDEDALGTIVVRRSALEALGKVDYKPGRDYLLQGVVRSDLDLNYLPAYAIGTAHLGDSVALATLRASVRQQQARGEEYFKAAAPALGDVPSADAVPVIAELLEQHPKNHELLVWVVRRLFHNDEVKRSPAFAHFVRQFVLTREGVDDELKSRLLGLLDEVKTDPARETLEAIVEGSKSDRLRQSAGRVLSQNFPPAPAVQPASGKKGAGKKQ